ncbi:MAG: flagellar filament capping protein FliD [Deltaproteobacteria bacterium]|nr:flagellar filament capping protein FliD [Deltaproteobacteria bacterium]
MKKIFFILILSLGLSPIFAQEDAPIPGHGVGNGGDEIRRTFIETGLKVLDYLSSTPEGKNIINRFNLDLSLLTKQLTIQKIKVVSASDKKNKDVDNGGSKIDSVIQDDKLWLIQERWDIYLRDNRPLSKHIFHELLRMAGYQDDDYVISLHLSEIELKNTFQPSPLAQKSTKDLEILRMKLATQVAILTDLYQQLGNFRGNLYQFLNTDDLKAKVVSSSDPNVVMGTANSKALNSIFTLSVERLATNEVWAARFSGVNESVTETDAEFTIQIRGHKNVFDIPKGTSLLGFAEILNSSSKEIQATVFDTGAGGDMSARLIITDKRSGQRDPDNSIWHPNFQFELSTLTHLSAANFSVQTQGQDSLIIVGSNSIYRDSNEISDFIPGVKLTLHSADPGDLKTISVTESGTQSAVTKLKDLIKKYNSIITWIQKTIGYEVEKKNIPNLMAGDSLLVDILWQLTTSVTDIYSNDSRIKSLSELGIFTDSDRRGLLSLKDEAKLNLILTESYDDLRIFFEGKNDNRGFAKGFDNVLLKMVDPSNGSLPLRIYRLNTQIIQIENRLQSESSH